MNRCQSTCHSNDATSGVARSLAPDDIAVGDFVAVLRVVYELPSFMWDSCGTFADRGELVRLAMIPEEASEPLKVKAVCLPFVLVKSSQGKRCGLDIRRFHLARLNNNYARAAWKASKRKKTKSQHRKRK